MRQLLDKIAEAVVDTVARAVAQKAVDAVDNWLQEKANARRSDARKKETVDTFRS